MASGEERKSNPFTVLTEQYLEAWRRANALNQEHLAEMALFWDPRLRARWFAQLTRIVDNYMRSPTFLELMQHNLRAITRPTSSPSSQQDRRVSDGDHVSRLP